MNQIITNLSDVSWWFGVVVVGLILNLGTAYLKPAIDQYLSKFSERKKQTLKINSIKEANILSDLELNKEFRDQYSLEVISDRIICLILLCMCIIFNGFCMIVKPYSHPSLSDKFGMSALLLIGSCCVFLAFLIFKASIKKQKRIALVLEKISYSSRE